MTRGFRRPAIWLFAMLLTSLVVVATLESADQVKSDTYAKSTGEPDPSAPLPAAPAGSARCMFCHPAEVEGYARSTMAHSLRRAGREPGGVVETHGSKITTRSTADGYWQRWENGSENIEYRINYVIGSGTHASGYLANVGGHLFQSPLAFYSIRQNYDLAPGYENVRDPDFTRPVGEECVLCHSGTALHVPGTLNEYRNPIFTAEAITCERCHGPVERHLADPRAGTIVNPTKLERAARDSVCEQCHLFGVARVPNPGKELSDFVPGQRLEDTFTIYHNAVPSGAPTGALKVISHVEQLALSVCAQKSLGRLWCGTCHDAHNKPVEPVAYYRARCLSCHATNFRSGHPSRDSDCLGCHMPRRNAQDGGHSVFTDHRIQRRPSPETEAPSVGEIAAWREPAVELQQRNLGIAHIAVGMDRHSLEFITEGYRALAEVQKRFADDSQLFEWMGDALLVRAQTADAKVAFERAVQLDPDSPVTEASAASPYLKDGDVPHAMQHLTRAVSADPLYLPAVGTLIELYQKQGKAAEAAALAERIKAAINEAAAPERALRGGASSDPAKKTEDVFKNIQVLKGVPAAQLISTMEFISSSLGAQCSFCHVDNGFEKDDKEPKRTARKMMRMVLAVNKNSFENQREVTCYTCHRGSADPIATPVVDDGKRASSEGVDPDAAELPTRLPTTSEVIANYVAAVGGAEAIGKITSLVEKGTASVQGKPVPVEIVMKAGPAKRALVWQFPSGGSSAVFDGHTGWFVSPGHLVHEMDGADLEAARVDADLQFPLHIRELYPELRIEYPEKAGGQGAFVLCGVSEGQRETKLYFSEQSGLLLRMVRMDETLLGANQTQIEFGDYRVADGVKIPFRMTLGQPGSTTTIQIERVQANVPIDEREFARPPVQGRGPR